MELRLETLQQQLATAKEEVQRPFPQEEELAKKSARLSELNSLLNMDKKGKENTLGVDEAAVGGTNRSRQASPHAERAAVRSADSMKKPSVLVKLHEKQAERAAELKVQNLQKSKNMEL